MGVVTQHTGTDLQGIQHSLSSDNDLFWLLFHRQGSDQSCHFLSCLPLGQLTQTFLSRPHTRVDNLQEELACPWIEDEDCSVDWLRRQVTLKRLREMSRVKEHAVQLSPSYLVNGDPVHVSVVNKPDYLV